MALPTFDAVGSYIKTTGTACAPTVPAGGVANKIALVYFYKENTAAVTPPAGFTAVTNSPVATTTSVSQQHVFWKLLTGADSGTYSFSWTGSCYTEGFALHFSGGLTTGDPTEIDNAATSGSTSVSTTPAVSGTTLGTDRLLVWSATNFNGGATPTVPGSFTRRDSGSGGQCVCAATLGQSAQGATGSITGSYSISAVETAFLVAIIPTGGAAPAALYVPRRSGPNYRR